MTEKEYSSCCCGCCKENDPEKFEKKIKLLYFIVNIVIGSVTLAIIFLYVI